MLRNRIAFLACLILAGCGESRHESIVLPIAESHGCGAPRLSEPSTDLSWVRARTPIYRLTSAGEFAVGGFNGRKWKPLYSNLQTDDWPEVIKSPGGRWIVHVTGSIEKNREELWLFDVRTQTQRRIATVPLYHVSAPEFSPSGDTLAYYVSYDSRSTHDGDTGLHAHIDEQHRLVVRDDAGQERIVDSGTYDQCEGETIGIVDWVDDDRYLVYRISGEHFIADPRTGQRAMLFISGPKDAAYVW